MNPYIEKFMERPKSHKIAFWIASIVFVTFIFWQYFYAGLSERHTKLEEDLVSKQTEKVNEQRLANDLPRVREVVKDLEAKLKEAISQLPDKKEIPDLLQSISDLAVDAGLEISLFKPRPEVFKDFYAEVPVSVSVEGTYHQIATFFDEVGRLQRIVNISEIGMKEPRVEKGSPLVKSKTSCTATTFRYLDESERIKAPEEQAKKGKRRK